MLKKTIYLMILLVILPICLADTSFYKKNTNVDLKLTCTDSSGVLCTSNTQCNMTVFYPNNTYFVNNQNTTGVNSIYNYTLPNSNTSGLYTGQLYCTNSTIGGFINFDFTINNSGNGNTPSNLEIFSMIFLLILSIIFLVYAIILPWNNTFSMGAEGNTLIEIEYGKYVKILFFFFSYICFWVMTWMLDNFCFNYLTDSPLSLYISSIFIIETILIIPLVLVCCFIGLMKHLTDSELVRMQKRGLLPR